jgi:hypothetical protein
MKHCRIHALPMVLLEQVYMLCEAYWDNSVVTANSGIWFLRILEKHYCLATYYVLSGS